MAHGSSLFELPLPIFSPQMQKRKGVQFNFPSASLPIYSYMINKLKSKGFQLWWGEWLCSLVNNMYNKVVFFRSKVEVNIEWLHFILRKLIFWQVVLFLFPSSFQLFSMGSDEVNIWSCRIPESVTSQDMPDGSRWYLYTIQIPSVMP